MASYFVACNAWPDGAAAVHDRSRCPPAAFPAACAEYLGEFVDVLQAVAVARLRYTHAKGCPCCEAAPRVPTVAARQAQRPLSPLGS